MNVDLSMELTDNEILACLIRSQQFFDYLDEQDEVVKELISEDPR